LTFYERFAEKNATNTKLRLESARAYERVGELQRRMGQNEKAEQAFRRALSTLEQFSTQVASSPSLVSVAAKARAGLGDLFRERKEFDSADRFYTQAIELLIPVAAADFHFREDLARARFNYADSLTKQKSYDAAIAVLKDNISPLEDGADYPRARFNSSMALRSLSAIYESNGDHQASRDALKLADEYFQPQRFRGGPGGQHQP
jgi:tetratricopeptide (TPR) repeat protein